MPDKKSGDDPVTIDAKNESIAVYGCHCTQSPNPHET
jgi:hypothetical protein